MELLNEIEQRRARRALSSQPLTRECIARLVKAATFAPSCFNNQPWRLIVVEKASASPEYEAVAASLTPGNAWALAAPVLVIFATGNHLDCRMDEGREYAYFDLGQAAMALQLQAVHEGLYAHPMAGFAPAKVRAAVHLPPELVPVCVVAVGAPGEMTLLNEGQQKSEVSQRNRKAVQEVAFLNSYGTRVDFD